MNQQSKGIILECRLWDKIENRMIYAKEVKASKDLLAIGLHGLPIAVDRDSFKTDEIVGWNVDHIYEPMLSTRFKDKNDRKVFFGDILEDPNTAGVFPQNDRWLVEQDKDTFGVSLSPIGKVCYPWRADALQQKIAGMEIVGNICQNPEMMGQRS